MSLLSHPASIALRNGLRRVGLTKAVSQIIGWGKSYEAAVDTALLGSLEPGDVVWDVGANVGHYTAKMADAVGTGGRVVAFEPSPVNLTKLGPLVRDRPNVRVISAGLSSQSGRMRLMQGADEIGATSRLMRRDESATAATHDIRLLTGDEVVATGQSPCPNVLKIDVEGHEYDVLTGLSRTLRAPDVRALVIEVHFGLLAAAGRPDAPASIEQLLKHAGFAVTWVDASHIFALRSKPGVN